MRHVTSEEIPCILPFPVLKQTMSDLATKIFIKLVIKKEDPLSLIVPAKQYDIQQLRSKLSTVISYKRAGKTKISLLVC